MPLNLGDLQFSVGADTSGLQKAAAKLVDFSKQTDLVAKRQSAGADEVAKAYRKQEAAMSAAFKQAQNFAASVNRAGADPALTKAAADAVTKYTQSLSGGVVSALGFQRANTRLSAAMGEANRQLSAFKTTKASEETAKFQETLLRVAKTSELITGPLGEVSSRITAFNTVVNHSGIAVASMVAGLAAGVLVIHKFGDSMIRAHLAVDSFLQKGEAVTGSQEMAGAAFQQVTAIANRTGMSITELGDNYLNFAQQVRDTSLEGQKGAAIFETVAAALAKVQASPQQATSTFNTLGQMLSGVTVKVQQFRGLTDSLGIGLRNVASESGMTAQAFNKLVKSGQMLSEDMLPILQKALTKTFHLDGEPENDLEASFGRLHNASLLFFNALDQTTGTSRVAKGAIETITRAVSGLTEALGSISGPVGVFLTAISAFGGAYATITLLTKAVSTLGVSMGILNATTLANPIVRVMTLAAAAITAASFAWGSYTQAAEAAAKATKDSDKSIDGFIASLNGGSRTLAGTAMIEQQAKAIADAQKAARDAAEQRYQISIETHTVNYGNINRGIEPANDNNNKEERLAEANDNLRQALSHVNDEFARMQKLKDALAKEPPKGISTFDNSKQLEAMAKANAELEQLQNNTNALQTGGIQGLDRVKALNEVNLKVLAYAKLTRDAGLSSQEAAEKTEQYRLALIKYDETLKAAQVDQAGFKLITDAATTAFESLGTTIDNWATKGKVSLSDLRDVAASTLGQIEKMIIKLGIINPIINGIFGATDGGNLAPTLFSGGQSGGGMFGSLFGAGATAAGGGIFSALFGGGSSGGSTYTPGTITMTDLPALASGGNAKGGQGYLVGEEGPEWFEPGVSGNVMNTRETQQALASGGSSGDVHLHLSIQTGVSQTIRAEVMSMLPSIKNETKRAVMDARQRGGKFAEAFRSA